MLVATPARCVVWHGKGGKYQRFRHAYIDNQPTSGICSSACAPFSAERCHWAPISSVAGLAGRRTQVMFVRATCPSFAARRCESFPLNSVATCPSSTRFGYLDVPLYLATAEQDHWQLIATQTVSKSCTNEDRRSYPLRGSVHLHKSAVLDLQLWGSKRSVTNLTLYIQLEVDWRGT